MDGYTLTLAANPWNIVRTYKSSSSPAATGFVVYMSEADNVYDPLYGSFAGDQGAWSTAKMYFTVPPNGVAKLHFGAHCRAQPDGRTRVLRSEQPAALGVGLCSPTTDGGCRAHHSVRRPAR